MRRIAVALLVALTFSLLPVTAVAAPGPIKVFVDGRELALEVPPQIIAGRTMVPVRAIFEALGANVHWDAATRSVTAGSAGTVIRLSVGQRVAYRNDVPVTLEAAPVIVGNRTLVPARFVGETFGARVDWNPDRRTVSIARGGEPSRGTENRKYEVVGYYVQYGPNDHWSYDSLSAYYGSLDTVATFQYSVDANGNLKEDVDTSAMQKLAREKGIKVLALIHNISPGGNFNRGIAQSILSSKEMRGRFINNVLRLLKEKGYAGVNLDLENVDPWDRENLSSLLKEMSAVLAPEGYLTTISVPAETEDNPRHGWSGAFDYAAIGRYADAVMIMTYDEHYVSGWPGPVASIGWVEDVVRYAASVIPPSKIRLGMATYGYDWPEGAAGGRSLATVDAQARAARYGAKIQWDDQAQVPYFRYNGRIVYFENADSASHKFELVTRYGLGGIAIWRLGYEEPAFWTTVDAMLRR